MLKSFKIITLERNDGQKNLGCQELHTVSPQPFDITIKSRGSFANVTASQGLTALRSVITDPLGDDVP